MSKFSKIVSILIVILFFEGILIYRGYVKDIDLNTPIGLKKYNPEKPIVLVIDISSNLLSVCQDGNVLKTYPVASGKPETPSPIGTWKVVSKGAWGDGFGGSWMGLNVPWGNYGIHGTLQPGSIGWRASHGCIRMNNNDAAELYKYVRTGTYVIIWGGPYGNLGESLRIISPGDRGSDVYEIQKLLKSKGYYNATPDGIYGELMKKAIHRYQADNNLPLSNDVDIRFYRSLGIRLID